MKNKKKPLAAGSKDSETKAIAAFRRGLASLNLSEQKAIFNRLSPGIRAALWKDRIREALSASLTRDQKEILRQIDERITAAAYDDRNSTQRKRFDKFCRQLQPRILAAFESEAAKFNAISTLLGERNHTARIAQSPGLPPCDCSLAARQTNCDDCSDSTNCKKVGCVATKFGCGCWWLKPCDGISSG